jgi:hypothetical protein
VDRMGRRAAPVGAEPERKVYMIGFVARRASFPLALGLVLVVASAAAWSVDVVRTGYGVKGDEATYVAMALSVAHDGDLTYERRDLERFWAIYQTGPEGIFLKRGQTLRLRASSTFPFVRLSSRADLDPSRLYFGKAFAYSVAVAPFVRVFGMNGFLLFHVWLLGLCVYAGYVFLRARGGDGTGAGLFAAAFLGLSITPLYLVWLTPEIFHVGLVFLAYFLWFYREVAPPASTSWGRAIRSDHAALVAAVLLGMATFSKPPNLLLAAPIVLLLWGRRQFWRGLIVGTVFVATVAGLFGVNALVTGDFNYQGGDRKTYYGTFPFQHDEATFDRIGIPMSTSEVGGDELREREGTLTRLGWNAWYFMSGRHAGFVPYFFPGVALLAVWLWRRDAWRPWHWSILAVLGASAFILLFALPYSWSGGGGPPGNRYFLSLYPALFFITPPLGSVRLPVVAIAGGALALAHILVNPFVAAKWPWIHTQQGVLRWLPVELTMVNDLPVMLNGPRARVPYGSEPGLLLYFLDEGAWLPEPGGMWVAGRTETQIIVRTDRPLERLTLTLTANVTQTVSASAGGERRVVEVAPGTVTTLDLPASGVATRGHAYLLKVRTSSGAVPALTEFPSRDPRLLGVMMQIQGRLDRARP